MNFNWANQSGSLCSLFSSTYSPLFNFLSYCEFITFCRFLLKSDIAAPHMLWLGIFLSNQSCTDLVDIASAMVYLMPFQDPGKRLVCLNQDSGYSHLLLANETNSLELNDLFCLLLHNLGNFFKMWSFLSIIIFSNNLHIFTFRNIYILQFSFLLPYHLLKR